MVPSSAGDCSTAHCAQVTTGTSSTSRRTQFATSNFRKFHFATPETAPKSMDPVFDWPRPTLANRFMTQGYRSNGRSIFIHGLEKTFYIVYVLRESIRPRLHIQGLRSRYGLGDGLRPGLYLSRLSSTAKSTVGLLTCTVYEGGGGLGPTI